MPETTRAEAIATLDEGHAKIDALLARLDDDALTRPSTIGGGDWSAKDLLGHVAFWEELALDLLAAQRDRRPPRASAILGVPGGTDRANAENQARTAVQSLPVVRQRAAAAHSALVAAIAALSDADWTAEPTYQTDYRKPLGEILGGITGADDRPFGHAWAHLPDLEAYVATVGAA